jgi:hypothetical protein
MKALEYVDAGFVVSIDIETVRLSETFGDLPNHLQAAWEYKHKQDGVVPDWEELYELWVKSASLYAEFSKVCAVSLVLARPGKAPVCKQYVSESELMILKTLANDLNAYAKADSKYTLIGHSAKFFDYPFLFKRYIINGLLIPSLLDTSAQKPWESKLLCTNDLWKSAGAFNTPGSSLQALCAALNVPTSKVDLVGDQVGQAYFNGELIRIADYCNLDAIACLNVFRKFKRLPIFSFDEVKYVNKDEVLEPVPFLTHIHKTKILTQEQAEKIAEFCEDLNVEEINNVKLILESALVNSKGKLAAEHADFIDSL